MSDTDPDTSAYLPPSQLAEQYGVSDRTIDRWAKAGQVRTIPNPRRTGARLYHAGDVEHLARAVPSHAAPEPNAATQQPGTELVPLSDLLHVLNRKDVQLAEANEKLQRATVEFGNLREEIGRLQGRLEAQQHLLEAAETEQERRLAAESERDRLRRDLSRLPWLLRIFFLRRR